MWLWLARPTLSLNPFTVEVQRNTSQASVTVKLA